MRIDVDIRAVCAASGTVRARIPAAKPTSSSFTTAEPKNLGVSSGTQTSRCNIFSIIYLHRLGGSQRGRSKEEGCTRRPSATAAPK